MENNFEKESILIEWVPYSIMMFLSLVFLIFAVMSEAVLLTIGSLSCSILFAFYPLINFLYLQSFSSIKVENDTIEIIQKRGSTKFKIPHDLRRVKIGADDLQIELKKNGQRFVLRSIFLKNKFEFHKLFDQIIKDHPPPEDKVILGASVLEMMEGLKNNNK